MAHSLQAVSLDKLQGFLECSICLEKLTNPRTLPCFHSYCLPCLEEFVNKKRADTTVPQPLTQFDCPECRRPFSLNPEEKVVDMSPNHFVVSMLEVMALDQHRVTGVPCSHDCEASSVRHCVDCKAFLCESCLSDHNRFKGNKSHSVLSMDELSKPENWSKVRGKQRCQQHSSKKLKFYCETCQQLICRDCTDFNHEKANHHWLPIATVAEKERRELNEIRDVLKGRLTEGNKTAQEIAKAQKLLDVAKEEAMRSIIQRKDKLLKEITVQLNKKANDLMAEYNESYTKERNSLLQLENKTKADVEQLENYVNVADVLIEQATDEDVVSSARVIKKNCESQRQFPRGDLAKVTEYISEDPVDMDILLSYIKQMGYVKRPVPQGLKNENLEGDKAGHTGSSTRRNRSDPGEYEASDASRPEADAAANKEPWPGISVAQFIHTVYADDLETFKSQNYVDVVLSEDKQMLTLLPMRGMNGLQLEEVRLKFQAFYETTSKNLTTGTLDLSGYPRDEAEQIKKSIRRQKGKNDVMVAETGENNDVYIVYGQAENIEMFRRNVMDHRVHGASPTQRAVDDGGSMVTSRKGVRVVLAMGALEKQDSEAIVNFTDNELAHKKGLSGAIREAAGAPFWNECRQIISRNGALVAGMVTVTTAGELPSRYVMNAILGDMSKERRQEALRHHLEEICRQVLLQATEKNLQSISFPIITPDIANLLTPVSSRLLLQVIKNFIETQSSIEGNTLKEIRIVYLKNSKDAESFKKEFQLQF